jgi:hypothetical protein
MVDQEKMSDVDKNMNPILNKGNYDYWKIMTEDTLVFLGCWDALDSGLTPAERLRSENVKNDNKARAYIFRYAHSEYLTNISTLKTAKECWKTLEDIHGRATSMDIVLCMRELGTIEKTPSMGVSTYCGRIQVLCDKLSRIDINIEDYIVAYFFLAGLTMDLNYSTNLRVTKVDKDLTSKAVNSDLLLEERRTYAAAESSEQGGAMVTRRQWKPKLQQNKDDEKPKNKDPHDQKWK